VLEIQGLKATQIVKMPKRPRDNGAQIEEIEKIEEIEEIKETKQNKEVEQEKEPVEDEEKREKKKKKAKNVNEKDEKTPNRDENLTTEKEELSWIAKVFQQGGYCQQCHQSCCGSCDALYTGAVNVAGTLFSIFLCFFVEI
jgi:hypothetical protein